MDKINFSAFCLVILVALTLAMCGVLLINSSTNIAYAAYSSGSVVNNNLLDGYFLDGHELDVSSSLQNGQWFASSGVTISPSISGLNISAPAHSYFMYTIPVPSSSNITLAVYFSSGANSSISLYDYNFSVGNTYNGLGACNTINSRVYYFLSTKGSNISGYSSFGLYFNASVTCKVEYIKCETGQYFTGQPRNNYLPNGYDKGFTDGVNSSSGGTISPDITDLTGMVWVVPDSLTVVPDDYYTYHVSGTVKHIINNREVISDFDSIQLYPTSDLAASSSALCFYQSDDSDFELTARPDFVITFTGGSDITNSDLISWLSSNNQFLTYTQGYQDGYNDGLDIGYDNGYYDGMGSIYTGVLSDYSILSDYSSYGVNNNDLNISSFTMDTNYNYTEFNFNGSTICNNYVRVVGSDDYSGSYTITYTRSGMGTYVGALISSFYIDENSIYKFMFNPEDSFNICIAVFSNDARTSQYLEGYWTYELQSDGYINGVPYMDLTPYIKVWAQYPYCNIYLYNPVVWNGTGEPNSLVLHNRTPIYGLLGNSLIVDNSNGNYNQGFRDGQLQGENIGFTKGWNKANSTGPNSFLGLFSAVIDAPINVISQTLDFDLLGFNLRDFFFSMVSIAVILFILRLIL